MVLGKLFPSLEAIGHPLLRPNQRDLVDQRVRHGCFGIPSSAREEMTLDRDSRLFIAQALDQVVVIILRSGTHAADIERELWPDRIPAGGEIVAHRNADIGGEIETGEGPAAARLRHPLQHRVGDRLRLLRGHEDRQSAVRHFARGPQPSRRDCRGVDPQSGIAMDDATQRLAEPGRTWPGIGDLIMLAVKFERRLALEDLPDDRDVFPRA